MVQLFLRYRWFLVGLLALGLGAIFVVDNQHVLHISAARLAYQPHGTLLAAATGDGVRVWRMPERQSDPAFNTAGGSLLVAWSRDGRLLAADTTNDTISIWRVADGTRLATIPDTHQGLNDMAFSPNGQILATVGRDALVRLWQVSDGQLFRTFPSRYHTIMRVAFSPDGAFVAAGSLDLTIWSLTDGRSQEWTRDGRTADVRSLAFSPDGQVLATGDPEGQITFWHFPDGAIVQTIQSHHSEVSALAYSPDGRYLATGSGMRNDEEPGEPVVRLWDVQQGTLVRKWTGHWGIIKDVAFSPDGRVVASASIDQTIRLWDVPSIAH